jgi:hypothetical protein
MHPIVGFLSVPTFASHLHVVAADADRVELGHVCCCVGHDVTHNAHGGARGVDVCVAHHELLQQQQQEMLTIALLLVHTAS